MKMEVPALHQVCNPTMQFWCQFINQTLKTNIIKSLQLAEYMNIYLKLRNKSLQFWDITTQIGNSPRETVSGWLGL